MNLKLIFITLLVATYSLAANSQDEEPYKDILFLIIDGEYEKALAKAEKYTEKDKTDREPVPYIYASMALYEMSKEEKFQEDYPRAFRDAIKYAYKAKRYDDENIHMPQHMTYINELKAEIMREARFNFSQENWRKSVTYSKYVNRIDPNDISALLLKGIAETRGRNAYQAEKTFVEADTVLKAFSASDISSEGKDAYLYAIIEYAKLMQEEGTKKKAQPYLNAVAAAYEDDAEYSRFVSEY